MSRHIVIVGGTRGLGLSLATASAKRGDRVTVVSRNLQHAEEVAAGLGAGAAGAQVDLNDMDSIERLFAGLDEIDHLVLVALDRDIESQLSLH